jgi:hypothetical protein
MAASGALASPARASGTKTSGRGLIWDVGSPGHAQHRLDALDAAEFLAGVPAERRRAALGFGPAEEAHLTGA